MKSLMVLALALAVSAHADTFVGNGGSEGDVELAVTLMQIREAMQTVQKKDPSEAQFCECNHSYHGRAVCEPLRALTEEQQIDCSRTVYKQADQILAKLNHDGAVRIVWTNSPIEVKEGARERAADAVANREKGEITVNLPHFRSMQPAERVFLLTHELYHFTDLDGKPLTDQGAVGPFRGEGGKRELLNAMAAATAILPGAYPRELKTYGGKLSRSQAWKRFWIGAEYGGASAQSNYSDSFAMNSYLRAQLSFRYDFTDNWGLVAAYRNESQSKTQSFAAGDIDSKEEKNIFGLGVSYRVFMGTDPLTFVGQSHILTQLMAESVRAKYTYGDNKYLSYTDSAAAFGGSLSASYYMPLWWGLWGYVGAAYEYHPYKYTDPTAQLNLNMNHGLLSGFLGVSYAF